MPIELITGHAGEDHVSAEDARAMHRGIFGNGNYILEGSDPEKIVPEITVTIPALELMLNGSHARTTGTDSVTFNLTSQGMKRLDYIVARYRLSGSVERMEIAVVEGTASENEPQLPTLVRTATTYEYPLYLAMISTGSVESIQCVLGKLSSMNTYHSGTLPIEKGGTGAKNADDARAMLGISPIWKHTTVESDVVKVSANGYAFVNIPIPDIPGYVPCCTYGQAFNLAGVSGLYSSSQNFSFNHLRVSSSALAVICGITNLTNRENSCKVWVGVLYFKRL